MGTVGTTITIKGKRVRLRERFVEDDRASFRAALDKVSDDAKRMRKEAVLEAKTGRHAFRRKKAAKNADQA